MVEHPAVNGNVVGSSPTRGALGVGGKGEAVETSERSEVVVFLRGGGRGRAGAAVVGGAAEGRVAMIWRDRRGCEK